ncbi:MAG: type II toxin-antitoxin system RelE/ParE family toxin [Lachnospiraceae bacterium]|nr:type II toxin-antitoxin system RelE/ParE family toxin [Lachnospiraceae bacterium]
MAKVMFTEPAEYDLQNIEYYIFVELCNPSASERIANGILDAAENLSYYPEKHPLVGDELLRNIGLRMTRFNNYNIFYYYASQFDTVYIIRILYNKANWESILKKECGASKDYF